MSHATLDKFGFPATLIAEGEHWVVLLRPQQVTLGSLVLAAKSSVTAFAELPAEAFAEMQAHVRAIESTLQQAFSYQRINYLMLMMVDPQVHFHVLPRYEGERSYAGLTFSDAGWPGPPRLDQPTAMPDEAFDALLQTLKSAWPKDA
ncbi:MAG: HIT family protein [Wenzhouxiangellaceae bacterium]